MKKGKFNTVEPECEYLKLTLIKIDVEKHEAVAINGTQKTGKTIIDSPYHQGG